MEISENETEKLIKRIAIGKVLAENLQISKKLVKSVNSYYFLHLFLSRQGWILHYYKNKEFASHLQIPVQISYVQKLPAFFQTRS